MTRRYEIPDVEYTGLNEADVQTLFQNDTTGIAILRENEEYYRPETRSVSFVNPRRRESDDAYGPLFVDSVRVEWVCRPSFVDPDTPHPSLAERDHPAPNRTRKGDPVTSESRKPADGAESGEGQSSQKYVINGPDGDVSPREVVDD